MENEKWPEANGHMRNMRQVVLFHPHIPGKLALTLPKVLSSRWIGQGPRVDEFEEKFCECLAPSSGCVAVGSGTDALHLAYILVGVGKGDEVVTPAFTCAATNIPLLYQQATPIFADVDPDTMNMDIDHALSLVTKKTKAIVAVHYGGFPVQGMEKLYDTGLPVVEDCAQAIGAGWGGQPVGTRGYGCFSFQAIKHITTGDGGMLVCPKEKEKLAKRIRWFGIDREKKLHNRWQMDITEVGYKYQMTDIAATMGLAGLTQLDMIVQYRRALFQRYSEGIQHPKVRLLGTEIPSGDTSPWIATVLVEDSADRLQKHLAEVANVETAQVHYRNDRYAIFGQRRKNLPMMDLLEDKYLVLPIHTRMGFNDIDTICAAINEGY